VSDWRTDGDGSFGGGVGCIDPFPSPCRSDGAASASWHPRKRLSNDAYRKGKPPNRLRDGGKPSEGEVPTEAPVSILESLHRAERRAGKVWEPPALAGCPDIARTLA